MMRQMSARRFEALGKAYGAPLFLVTEGRMGPVVHSTARGNWNHLRDVALFSGFSQIDLRRYAPADLEAPRDLESLLARVTRGQEIAIDPTGAFVQARRLVGFAAALRDTVGSRLRGIYFDAARPRVLAWLAPGADAAGAPDDLRQALRAADGHGLDLEVELSIRRPHVAPGSSLVPVDRPSRRALAAGGVARRIATAGATVAAMLGLGAATSAAAQDIAPAGSVGVVGGLSGGDAAGSATAQLGIVGDIFLQTDIAGLTSGDDIDGFGFGGQAGFNVAESFRGGVFAYKWKLEDYDGSKYGAFGEVYVDSLTFRLEGGRIDGELDDADTYARARVSYYVDDNTRLFAEGGTLDDGWGGGGVEHAFSAMPGLVAGVSGRAGSNDDTVQVFVRWYFGGGSDDTLKTRDRTGLAESLLDMTEMRRTVQRARAAGYGGAAGD